jgi:DNA-binding Xre family transcriptional regulator
VSSNALSHNLHKLMSEQRLSSSELGRRIQIPGTTIKGIRNGDSINPTLTTLTCIAKYFEITISELVDDYIYAQQKKDSFSKIPIITWDESISWSSSQLSKHHELCLVERILSKEAFALHMDTDDYNNTFKKDEYIIIDPLVKPLRHDYILVSKPKQPRPSIKKLLLDEGNSYIQSISVGLNTTVLLTEKHKVIGVVLGYKRWFKI